MTAARRARAVPRRYAAPMLPVPILPVPILPVPVMAKRAWLEEYAPAGEHAWERDEVPAAAALEAPKEPPAAARASLRGSSPIAHCWLQKGSRLPPLATSRACPQTLPWCS
ncbi:MAG: hypothetical protein ACR2JE_12290 [Acidobacteriaceae bacterium]